MPLKLGYLRFLLLAFVVQVFGFLLISYENGSAFGNLLFYQFKFIDHWSYSIERALLTIWLLCLPLVFMKGQRGFFIFYIIPFLFPALYKQFTYSDPFASYSWMESGVRWLLPLSLFFLMGEKGSSRGGRWLGHGLLRIGICLTFVGHGLKCLGEYPLFADFLFTFFNGTLSLGLEENVIYQLLHVIGILDIFVGLIVLLYAHPLILFYLAFWGLLTATYRFWYMGSEGLGPFLLRAAHFTVPLYFLLRNTQTSFSLKKILPSKKHGSMEEEVA